jgi:drug/metabolite transporter (DMT)-like permease
MMSYLITVGIAWIIISLIMWKFSAVLVEREIKVDTQQDITLFVTWAFCWAIPLFILGDTKAIFFGGGIFSLVLGIINKYWLPFKK